MLGSSLLTHQSRLEERYQQIPEYIGVRGSITQREYGAISSCSLASRKVGFEKLIELEMIEAKGGAWNLLCDENY